MNLWTQEQDQFIRENYGKMSAAAIAIVIGRTQSTVFSRAWRLRATLPVKGRNVKTLDITEEIARRYLNGETVESLCREVGVCGSVFVRELKRAGISTRTALEISEKNRKKALASIRRHCAAGTWGKIVSASHQGIPLREWRGFKYADRERLQRSTSWKQWRLAIFRRDHFTCVMCGDRSRKKHRVTLDPHHIYPKATYPWKVFDVNNGVTLCRPCHRSIARKEHLYTEQFTAHVQSKASQVPCSNQPLQLQLGV